MSLTLHLGVLDVPYGHGPPSKRRRRPAAPGAKTTGDVLEIIERKYKLIEYFYGQEQAAIAALLEDALKGSLESLMQGGPTNAQPDFDSATGKIEDAFRQALSRRAFDGRIQGVPTAAALRGVSHRFKHPYARRGERPSFIDTGLMQSSFRVWVD